MQQCMRACHHNVLSRRLKHIHVMQTRKLHAACMASESTPASGAAAGLSQYMTRLTQDEQADALSKFVAAGYTDAMHDLVTMLGNQELAEIGIQPQAVRSALLKDFAVTGPGKTYSIMSEAELLRENNGRGWVESCSKRRGVAETFTQLETWPRLLFGLLPHAIARLAAATLDGSPENYVAGQPNTVVAAVAEARLADADCVVAQPKPAIADEALVDALVACLAACKCRIVVSCNCYILAIRSKAAPAAMIKNKSHLNTSYIMLESVLHSGKFPAGPAAVPLAAGMAYATPSVGPAHTLAAPWPCIPNVPWIDPQAAQRLDDFHAHEAAGKPLKMKLLAATAVI
ncbi:hypothetical protein HaLaN_11018 [Haematococcus lacustris]|uniref:Uncharacterized protein n=1 Tax=Haematococcus lacustris TaxID=44745 RepID=A0A699Z6F1_HAELA|nr:hypothetical protein HaLaN_11018 [Haematococcus lacustris]